MKAEVKTAEPWPELPWTEWKPTIDTLHMWLQVAGKVRIHDAIGDMKSSEEMR